MYLKQLQGWAMTSSWYPSQIFSGTTQTLGIVLHSFRVASKYSFVRQGMIVPSPLMQPTKRKSEVGWGRAAKKTSRQISGRLILGGVEVFIGKVEVAIPIVVVGDEVEVAIPIVVVGGVVAMPIVVDVVVGGSEEEVNGRHVLGSPGIQFPEFPSKIRFGLHCCKLPIKNMQT
jgi:hypothetical protein